jgi:hypothetical protein
MHFAMAVPMCPEMNGDFGIEHVCWTVWVIVRDQRAYLDDLFGEQRALILRIGCVDRSVNCA